MTVAARFDLLRRVPGDGRDRVIRHYGPYRLVRHPVYLAEIVMSSALILPGMRLTLVVGECIVIVLQFVRIQAEEKLLAGTFLTFGELQKRTPYRLIPGVW